MDIQGTIQGVAKGGIVVAGNNQTWRVAIVPGTKMQAGTKVQVTGTATADSLRSGLIVELVAEIDSHGAVQGKVDALTITSLTREKQMGIFPSGDDSGFGGNGMDDSGKPAKRSGHTAGKAAPHAQTAGSYRVVGLLSVRGGALSVQPGRGRSALMFELAEQPKINIDTADLSLVRVGQDVSVKGFASPRQPSMIQAAEVKIKLPEPKGGDKKEPAAKPEAKDAKKAAKPAKKAEGEGLPEPDAKP